MRYDLVSLKIFVVVAECGNLTRAAERERNARGVGIIVYAVEPTSGRFERVQLVGDLVNPS